MARPTTHSDPVKLTLYIERKVCLDLKHIAKCNGTSVSNLVTGWTQETKKIADTLVKEILDYELPDRR